MIRFFPYWWDSSGQVYRWGDFPSSCPSGVGPLPSHDSAILYCLIRHLPPTSPGEGEHPGAPPGSSLGQQTVGVYVHSHASDWNSVAWMYLTCQQQGRIVQLWAPGPRGMGLCGQLTVSLCLICFSWSNCKTFTVSYKMCSFAYSIKS